MRHEGLHPLVHVGEELLIAEVVGLLDAPARVGSITCTAVSGVS